MSGDSTRESTRDNARVMGWESQHRFFWINITIKVIIIIVLKPELKIVLAHDLSHESCRLINWVNVRIKVVVIIVLKPDSRVDSGQGLSQESGGSTRVKPS